MQQQGLTWIDVQPALELVDSLAELKKAVSDPPTFFRSLSTAGGPAARRMLCSAPASGRAYSAAARPAVGRRTANA